MNVELALAWMFGVGAALSLLGGTWFVSEARGYDSWMIFPGTGLFLLTPLFIFLTVLFGSAA